jgi:electron-transferring-flavoprotein dehydrogenase
MSEGDRLVTDLLVVGGGPAGLAAAIRFRQLVVEFGLAETLPGQGSVMLLEKAGELGAHSISGAVIDPGPLERLFPDGQTQGAPLGAPVSVERHALLTRRHRVPLPGWGPLSQAKGRIVSLSRLVRWMAGRAEALGVDLAPGFPAVAPLLRDGRLTGVRTGDTGRDKQGRPRSDFEPGALIEAGVTILAEGARGSLTRQIEETQGLRAGRLPPAYSLGLKDVWEVPSGRVRPGLVAHLLGFPLGGRVAGGGFLYAPSATQVVVGLVVGLDSGDSGLDPFALFQELKTHPWIVGLLVGGQPVRSGARVIDEGGWHARPRPFGDGFLLAGESAGLLDAGHLKGVHLAIESGMLAAETALAALRGGDVSAGALAAYEERLAAGDIGRQMRRVRNLRQALTRSPASAVVHLAAQWMTRGRGFVDPLPPSRRPGAMRPRSASSQAHRRAVAGAAVLDRSRSLFLSGTQHVEDQPVHLRVADTAVCVERCSREYGNPCVSHCPADVYAIEASATGAPALAIHAANCLHCKTCDIIDPYDLITWTPPEGGGGPRYEDM